MDGPVTDAAATYYGYWTPWLWAGAVVAVVLVGELAVIAVGVWRR